MKFKFPKKIQIGETEFKVIYDYKGTGASFIYPDSTTPAFIKFGMKNYKSNPLTFLGHLIHELKEIIQVEQTTRFSNRDENYIFSYNHPQHDDLCSRLAGLLNNFIK